MHSTCTDATHGKPSYRQNRNFAVTEATDLVKYVADEIAESGRRQRQVVNVAGKLIRRAT